MPGLNHSPAEVLAQYLGSAGVPFSLTNPSPEDHTIWPVFVNSLPVAPDNLVVVYSPPAKMEGRIMRTGDTVSYPGIQFRTRAVDDPTAFDVAWQIAELMDQLLNNVVTFGDGAVYNIHEVCRKSGLIPLEEEAQNRRISYVFNCYVTLNRES